MLNRPDRPNFVQRALATVAFLALMGCATADLKFLATVTGGGPGLPLIGVYEVDFKGDYGRIVEPGGRALLFNFVNNQVAALDPARKTYYTEFLSRFLEPEVGFGKTVSYQKDESTAPVQMFGTSASRVFISTLPTQNGPVAPGGGLRRFGARPGNNAGMTSVSGATWIADASNVHADVRTVAPLVWIGVPRVYASAITRDMDQNGSLPLSFSFAPGNNGAAFLTMQVTSVTTAALDPSLFAIPSGYRQVIVRK